MKKNILANCPECGTEIAATLVADILDPSEWEQRCRKSDTEKHAYRVQQTIRNEYRGVNPYILAALSHDDVLADLFEFPEDPQSWAHVDYSLKKLNISAEAPYLKKNYQKAGL